jgi:hypothetical protein
MSNPGFENGLCNLHSCYKITSAEDMCVTVIHFSCYKAVECSGHGQVTAEFMAVETVVFVEMRTDAGPSNFSSWLVAKGLGRGRDNKAKSAR